MTASPVRFLQSIFADFNSVVVNVVSNLQYLKPLFQSFGSYISTTFIFHCFFSSLERSRYFYIFSLSFIFTLLSAGRTSNTWQVFFFLINRTQYIIIIIIIVLLASFFHISINWWSFTGIWVTVNFLKPAGLYWIFDTAEVWMVSIFFSDFQFLQSFFKLLEIFPSSPTSIGITIIFMFHTIFSSFIASFYFKYVVCLNGKIPEKVGSLFLTNWQNVWPSGLHICTLKSQRILCVSFSRKDYGLCTYHLVVFLSCTISNGSPFQLSCA